MNKFLTKIATLSVGLAMAIGVGVAASNGGALRASADDETVTFSAQGYSNQQAISSYNGTNFSIAFNKGSNSNAPKYYTSGTAIRLYGGNYFTVTNKISGKSITAIVLTYGSSDGSNEITTDVGTFTSPSWSGDANSVKFTIGGTTGNRRLAAVKVTVSGGGEAQKLPQPTPVFNSGDCNVTWTVNADADHYEAKIDTGSYATATSPLDVSGLSKDTSHTVTVKAIAKSGDTAHLDSDEGSVTFVPFAHAGTEADPWTVAEAYLAIDVFDTVSNAYATGIVSEIVTPYDSQYGNISYNISEDGTTTADQLQAYRGKSYNGAKFTSEDDIQVGDIVVVKGNLKKYGTTYEFDTNNELVSLVRPGDPVLESISVKTAPTKTTYFEGDKFDPTGLELTLTYDDDSTQTVEYAGNESDFTFLPDLDTGLVLSNTSVTITYAEKTTSQAITVNKQPELTSISLNGTVRAKVSTSWDLSNVTVTGYFDGSSEGQDITSNCEISAVTAVPSAPAANVHVYLSVSFKGGAAITSEYVLGSVYDVIVTRTEIEFKNNGTDSNTVFTETTLKAYITSGSDYVSSATGISKAYPGTVGVKFGSSSDVGSITLGLSGLSDYASAKLAVSAKQYGSDTGNIAVASDQLKEAGQTSGLSNTVTEYVVGEFKSEPQSLTISTTSKRAYVTKVSFINEEIVEYTPVTGIVLNDGEAEHTTSYSIDMYEKTGATFTASVAPAKADQRVTWTSTGNIINENGEFLLGSYSEGDVATLTVTSVGEKQDGTHASLTVTINIIEDARTLERIAITGDWASKQYFDGDDFDTDSLSFKAVFSDDSELPVTLGAEMILGYYTDESCEEQYAVAKPTVGMTSVWAYVLYEGEYGIAEGKLQLTNFTVVAVEATYTRTAGKNSFVTSETFSYGGTVTETWNNDPEHPVQYTESSSHLSFELQTNEGEKITDIAVGDAMLVSYNGAYVVVKFDGNQVGNRYSISVAEAFDKSKGEYHLANGTGDLAVGKHITIAAAEADYVMTSLNTNNVKVEEAAKNESKGIIGNKSSVLDLELVEGTVAGTYGLKLENGKYLSATGGTSSNYLKPLDSLDAKGSFTFTYSDGAWTIAASLSGTNPRNTMMYNFGTATNLVISCYKADYTTSVSGVTVYVFETYSDEAIGYAQYFNSEVGGLCDAEGNTSEANVNSIKAKWSTLASKYSVLTDGAKDFICDPENKSQEDIARMFGMYEKIVSRYEQTNFIVNSKGVAAVMPSPYARLENYNDNSMIIVIVAASLSTIALAFLIVLKKKRRSN